LVDRRTEAVAAGERDPVADGDALADPTRERGPAPGAVVLQTAVDAVRIRGVDVDLVPLAQREVVDLVPGLGAVLRLVQTAVTGEQHVVAVLRVDPQRVEVDVHRALHLAEALAAVGALEDRHAAGPHDIDVARVDGDLAEVEGPVREAVHALPGQTAVVAPEDAAGLEAVLALTQLHVLALAVEAPGVRTRVGIRIGLALAFARAPGDLDLELVALALDLELRLLAALAAADGALEVLPGLHGLVADGEHEVAGLQTGTGGGAVLRHAGELRAIAVGGVLALHAEIGVARLVVAAHALRAGRPAAALGLDRQVQVLAVLREDGQSRTTPPAGRQALVDARPRVAAVGAAVVAGRRAEAHHGVIAAELVAPHLVQTGVHDARILRIDAHVDATGGLVDVEHLLPGLAAVLRAEDAAVGVRSPEATHRGDEHDVRVAGVDRDVARVQRLAQTHVGEGLAAVGRLVDPVAEAHRVARVLLAGADPDHVGVARRDRDIADRRGPLVLEDALPGGAGVARLPDPRTGGAEVPHIPLRVVHLDVGDAATHVGGPDQSPGERGGGGREDRVRVLRGGLARRGGRRRGRGSLRGGLLRAERGRGRKEGDETEDGESPGDRRRAAPRSERFVHGGGPGSLAV
jgi:hypothetical protein